MEGSQCHVMIYNLLKWNPRVYSHVLRCIEPAVKGSAAELRAGVTYGHHLEGIALSRMVQGLQCIERLSKAHPPNHLRMRV